ncbi:MAG: alpha-2-macroglobulin family protein, partial [Chloroflexota bacterium]|nr:alpha-2-macroglobulin family protein [Chloroflexota bacterium]
LYSDRPIYRPGQTVRLRGILRAERDVRYSLPDLERTVELSLRDPHWDTIYTTTATLSELGGFEADFELTSVAELGEYAVQARLEGVEHCWELPFTVAAYRKPEFEVVVSPEMDDLLRGETARVLVESNYYFGGAVSAAPLQWKVYAQPAHFAPGIEGWWRWGGGGWWQPEPEVIASGAATTDAQGRFLLELPAELAAWGDEKESAPGSQQWEFEVTVTDEAGFPVTGRGQLTVHATRFYLGLQPRQWVVTAGEQALVDVQALDWESVPVAEQEVEVKLAQRQWYQVPPAEPFAQSTWGYTDTVVSTLELVTDRQGRAEANVTPPNGGSYVILASATDADGRPVQAECRLWVSGPGGMAWKMAEGRVAPVADAESYRPGDTASILLPTPFEGPFQVLMTVERGSILETRRLVFDQANPTIELPIQSVYAPNIYVSFVVVKGKESLSAEGALVVGTPDVRLGLVELQVEPVAQTLAVELTANPAKANYQPGDEIELTVRTVDAEGRTVDSEVGIAVVDKAVLALKEPNALSIGERFYGQRPLGVRTGNSLLMLFNRLTADLEELAQTADRMAAELELGGRGGGGGGAPALAVVRHEFPDTALWETRLRTGLDGEATVSFELPDSLTTWQVDARAVTADTKVGDALEGLVISKPLLVRPVTPRFFVAGDQLAVAAVVHNNTAEQLQVAVRLDATGLAIEGDIEQLAIIPAGGRQRVSWPVSVPASGAKAALLTFSASADTYRDATRPTLGRPPDQALPIYRYETPDVMGASGVLDEAGSRLEAVAVPSQAGDDTELTVHLDASLAASMLNGLTYLENYPYGCTEQLVSRFLPNLLTYRALQELELVEPELAERLPGLVREGVGQLYARQNGDGGWGWWSTGQSTLQISAYATLGLLEAERAGFAVRDKELSLALFYLRQVLQEEVAKDLPQWTRAHTLAFYVISLAGRQWPENVANSLYAARDELGVTGRSQLALAFGVVDVADRRVTTLLDELRGDAEITATGAHWEDTDVVSWATDTRATAVALDALARLAPDDQLLSQVVRWLLTARRGDHWRTTQETAWSLMALTDYLVATGELQANYDWGVALNGVAINAGAVTPETIWASEDFSLGLTADPATGLVRERTNALEIARAAGSGNLYYTAHLTLYQPVEEVEAESRGITLQRAYCEPVEEPGAAPESCVPVASAAPGDLVEVRLTLILPYSRYHLILEDPYPAGMEPVDPTLLTEQQYLDGPDMQPEPLSRWGWWWNPFTHRELRDERAVFFAESLSSGTYQVRYLLRAALPGTYRVLPATASEMYFPEVWGRTAGDTFQVSE